MLQSPEISPRRKRDVTYRYIRKRAIVPLTRFARSEFVRHGTLVFAASMTVNAMNYVFHFFASRTLGVAGYGVLSSLVAAIALLSVPASILTTIVVKHVAELHATGDGAKVRQLADRVTALTAGLALLTVFLTWLLRSEIAAFLNLTETGPVVAAGFALAASLTLPAVRGVLQGTQDFAGFGISTVLEAVGKCAVGIMLAMAGFGVTGGILGFALGSLLGFGYGAVRLTMRLEKHSPGRFKIDYRRLAQTASGVGVSTMALTVLSFIDVILVKHFFGSHIAGLYGAISLTGKVFLFLGGFVPTVLMPKATAVALRGESPVWVIRQAALVSGAIILTTVALAFLFPQRILSLVAGRSFVEGAPLIFPYACAMALLGATNISAAYKMALHRFDFVLPLSGVAVAEMIAIAALHRTIADVVGIVLVIDLLALLVTSYRITSTGNVNVAPHAASAA